MITTFHYGDFETPAAADNIVFFPEFARTPRAIVQMAPSLIRPGVTIYTQSPTLILTVMDLVMRGEVGEDAVALYEHRPDGTVEAVQWPCEANGYRNPTHANTGEGKGLDGFLEVEPELTSSIYYRVLDLQVSVWENRSPALVIHDEGDEPEDDDPEGWNMA